MCSGYCLAQGRDALGAGFHPNRGGAETTAAGDPETDLAEAAVVHDERCDHGQEDRQRLEKLRPSSDPRENVAQIGHGESNLAASWVRVTFQTDLFHATRCEPCPGAVQGFA